MSFTNYGHWSQDHWAYVVYIHGGPESKVKGYYLYEGSHTGDYCGLTPCVYPIERVLYITKIVTIHMGAISKQLACQYVGLKTPKTVYDNYCKDIRAYEYYGYTYEEYLTNIVDAIRDDKPNSDSYVATQSDNDISNIQIILEQGKGLSRDIDTTSTHCDLNTIPCSDSCGFQLSISIIHTFGVR